MATSTPPARVRRTVLAVPGSSDRFIAKARGLGVDALFLDLEDAVAPAVKAESRQRIVAAPELAARCGLPENLEDLQRRYPLSSQINQETGRPWGWYFNEQQNFIPRRPALAATDGYSELAAALSGRVCAFILDGICQSELTAGKLIELLPDIPRQTWQLYLYRPYHSITPQRVLLVFDLLTQILQRYFPAVKNTMPV